MEKVNIIGTEPKIVELKDGDKVFGIVEETTSRELGAGRTNLTKITLWGPDFVHLHKKAEETYVCQEGEGEVFVNFEIVKFIPGIRVIIPPGKLHAARPKENGKNLVFYCLSAPAFNPEDSYPDRRGREWEIKIDPLELITNMSPGRIAHEVDWALLRLSGEFGSPESPEEREEELTNLKYGLAMIKLVKIAAADEDSMAFYWFGKFFIPPKIEAGELGWKEYNETRQQKIREIIGRIKERADKIEDSLEKFINSSEFSGPDLKLCEKFFLSIS